tara:strand:- start:185 stop:877 length:693 start_codon:yes stop_codon:yes gene_type:complete
MLSPIKIIYNFFYHKYVTPSLKSQKNKFTKFQLFEAIPRELHFIKALTFIENIEGSIAEAGVQEGASLLFLAGAARSLNMRRKIIAIDSFESFPLDFYKEGNVLNQAKKPKTKKSKEDYITQLKLIFKNINFKDENLEIIPGYFRDSLKNYNSGPIALLHLDVDLGSSYEEALYFLYPHVVKGGIILFDEYYPEFTKYKDAKEAIDKYLEDKSFEKIDTGYDKRLAIRKL